MRLPRAPRPAKKMLCERLIDDNYFCRAFAIRRSEFAAREERRTERLERNRRQSRWCRNSHPRLRVG